MDTGESLLRLPAVLSRIPVSKSLWWVWCKSGKAPAPIRISSRCTVWKSSEIDSFIEKLTGKDKP